MQCTRFTFSFSVLIMFTELCTFLYPFVLDFLYCNNFAMRCFGDQVFQLSAAGNRTMVSVVIVCNTCKVFLMTDTPINLKTRQGATRCDSCHGNRYFDKCYYFTSAWKILLLLWIYHMSLNIYVAYNQCFVLLLLVWKWFDIPQYLINSGLV